jgi:hypothetical protein
MRQVSEVSLLFPSYSDRSFFASLFLSASSPGPPIVDAEENRYYISLKGDLYLYVGPPKPENRFFLCTLKRTNAG